MSMETLGLFLMYVGLYGGALYVLHRVLRAAARQKHYHVLKEIRARQQAEARIIREAREASVEQMRQAESMFRQMNTDPADEWKGGVE